ncbi:type VI secretion system tube protein TssD [Vibrio sp. PP-XX7]
MAHLAYLTLRGEKQGLISSGCNTKDSMGNRYQETHTDQITVLACQYSLSKLPHQHGISHDGIQITKPKDKASPLLATAFAKQEHLEGTIDFYRTNEQGHYQKFYSVAFQKAVISSVSDIAPHVIHSPGEEMHDMITFRYKEVQWEHIPCGTLAYDGWESANSLAAIAPPLTTAERYAKQMKDNIQAEPEDEDWKPVGGNYPILVYETKNKIDDTSADDLQHGDLERKDIIRMGQLYNFAVNPDELAYPASWHFNILKSGTWLLSWGKYSPIIKEMIARFESNTGDTYESNLLNEAMEEHSTTRKFVSDIKIFTSDYVFSHNKQIGSDFISESKVF